MSFNNEIDAARVPRHVAIIMDGNGRWAKAKGLPRTAGHQEGVETVKKITEEAVRLGVKYLTLYTFSTENWNRPVPEIAALMGLILDHLEDEIFMKNNVRFRVIGDMSRIPEAVRVRLEECMQHTAANGKMTMVIALSYSSRWELVRAARFLAAEVAEKHLLPEDINEDSISSVLTTADIPDPDLLIRTGGEYRISNFLLWQAAYAELYFTSQYWPDFDEESLYRAICDYQSRERRFGKISEQL